MRGVLDVRPGERTVTFGAFAALFAITGGHTLLETARDALFLAKLPPERLPWMYLAIAAVGLLVARVGKRASGAVGASLGAAIAGTAAFWTLSSGGGSAFVYALFVWTGTVGSWMVLQFWLLLGGTMHVGQAKRLFGFIGAGGVLGATAGAATARAVAGTMETRHLLMAACVLFALAIVPARLVQARAHSALRPPERATNEPRATGSLIADARSVAGDGYLRRILGLVLVATVCLTFVDYVFKLIVAREVPKAELGTTFATIYTVLNGLALLVQIGLVGTALRALGVHRALAILPLLALAGGFGVAALPVLATAVTLKGFDGVLRHSMHKTTTELLYLPLAEDIRSRAKPVIDLVGQRGGQALASVVLLVAAAAGGGPRLFAGAVVALAALWLVLAITVGKPYLDTFRAGLARGIDADAELPELDLGALEALFAALNSPRDAEVLGALDLLAAQKRQRLIPALILYHPSREVVVRALDLLVEEGREDILPVTERLLDHADGAVRTAALRARAKLAFDADELRRRLGDERPEIRATALVTLASKGHVEGDAAHAALAEALADPSASVRMAVLRAIREAPEPAFVSLLTAHAAGERDQHVLMELALTAGAFGRSGADIEPLVGVLADLLPTRFVGPAARTALADLTRERVDLLAQLLESPKPAVAWAVPRVLELFPPRVAGPILQAALQSNDGIVRFRTLKALTRLRREDPSLPLDHDTLVRVASSTIKQALELVGTRVTLTDGQKALGDRATAAGRLLDVLLQDKLAYSIGRLFLVLGLLYPSESFERIHRGLGSPDPKRRASSRELCENVVEAPLRAPLLVLIDDLDDAQKIARAGDLAPDRPSTYDGMLAALCGRGDEVAALAQHHATELGVSVRSAGADGARGAFAARVRRTPSPAVEGTRG